MGITLKEIAEMAGVSRPAVSLVVKDPETKHVAPDKKREILRLLKKHQYRPDYAARKLRGMSTRSIGVIGSLFNVPVHSIITNGIMQHFQAKGYQVMLADHNYDLKQENHLVEDFVARGVDGVVFLNSSHDKPSERKFPAVYVTHNQKYFDIAADLLQGGRIAGQHLLEHGRKAPGFVGSSRNQEQLRHEGLVQSLREAGIDFEVPVIYATEVEDAFPDQIVNQVKNHGVDSFFCLNDYFATATISSLIRAGIRVPQDVAVIGFDGLSLGALTCPSLSTIVQPAEAMAKRCVELMLQRIDGAPYTLSEPELFSPALHIGESCGCENGFINKTILTQNSLLSTQTEN